MGRSTISIADMTPIAFIGSEANGIAVRAGMPHLALSMLAKAGGVDARRLKVVTFSGGSESSTQLLGGHIDVSAVSIDNTAPHHKSGAMRILGVSSAQRLPAIPDVPTYKEQGYDVVMSGFTIVLGPRGLTPPQVQYWENQFERVANTTEWKRLLAADLQDWDFKKSAATRDYLRQQYALTRTLLVELGMAK